MRMSNAEFVKYCWIATFSILNEINGEQQVIQNGNTIKHCLRFLHPEDWKCSCCGMKVAFFETVKKFKDAPLLILHPYGLNDKNEKVLFNRDHIIPRSKGGSDTPSNYQLMCEKCNTAKANKFKKSSINIVKYYQLQQIGAMLGCKNIKQIKTFSKICKNWYKEYGEYDVEQSYFEKTLWPQIKQQCSIPDHITPYHLIQMVPA